MKPSEHRVSREEARERVKDSGRNVVNLIQHLCHGAGADAGALSYRSGSGSRLTVH